MWVRPGASGGGVGSALSGEGSLHLAESKQVGAMTKGVMSSRNILREDASARWNSSSYKLTVSHSHANLETLVRVSQAILGQGLRLGLRLKDEVWLWERLLELILERQIAALR